MKQLSLLLVAVFVLLAVATIGGAFFVVNEAQQVIITQFGKPVGRAYHHARPQGQNPLHPEGELLR